jgi:hypothetical protein
MLSGLVDRFTTFMREPMYSLGNALSDYIYVSKTDDASMVSNVLKSELNNE